MSAASIANEYCLITVAADYDNIVENPVFNLQHKPDTARIRDEFAF